MPDAQILLVDDDPSLLRVVEVGLAARGYAVAVATTGRSALEQLDVLQPALVVLDLGLPDMDGLDVSRHIQHRSKAAVLVLSADGAEDRKVRALEEGADDYLTKPFSMAELQARVGVALRHQRVASQVVEDDVLVVGSLQLDPAAHEARLAGSPLDLTPKEFALLTLLARNLGKVLTHRTLLDAVWGPGQALDTLRTHISQLRRKLADAPDVAVVTESGVGYRLVVTSP